VRGPEARSLVILAVVLGASALILTSNAWNYSWADGYDATKNAGYADYLIERGHIPTARTNPHYYTPPGYFAIAGAIDWTATKLGAREPQPRKAVQLFNVPLVLGTAVLIFLLVRTLWPTRRFLQVAAVVFFAFTPVVLKTGAMFHPATLNLFLATLALYLTARMVVQQRFGWRSGVGIGIVLGAGQLVRSEAISTLVAVLLVLLVVALSRTAPRRAIVMTVVGVLISTTALAGWWYVRQDLLYGSPLAASNPPFTTAGLHPGSSVGPWTLKKPVWERRPLSFYVDPGLPQLFSHPYRPAYVDAGFPVTYSDVWGDWLGAWKWGINGPPTPAVTRELALQNAVGILPTLLGVAGCIALIGLIARRRDGANAAIVLVPGMIVASLLAYAYTVIGWPSPDGDILKATYMIASVPAWAIAAAYALDRMSRWRALHAVTVMVLVASVFAELRFIVA
jgi:hypothetical protein